MLKFELSVMNLKMLVLISLFDQLTDTSSLSYSSYLDFCTFINLGLMFWHISCILPMSVQPFIKLRTYERRLYCKKSIIATRKLNEIHPLGCFHTSAVTLGFIGVV